MNATPIRCRVCGSESSDKPPRYMNLSAAPCMPCVRIAGWMEGLAQGALQWTRTLPTVPGWYWVKAAPDASDMQTFEMWRNQTVVMTSQNPNGRLMVCIAEDEYWPVDGSFGPAWDQMLWAGPIPQPEEPKEPL